MAPPEPRRLENPRLRILSVGGNSVSAFLSWRLQATNACDITLVWKNGYEHVAQYGISFRSQMFGNERFKPRQVVRSPEEAAQAQKTPFDYVLLCIKALPDVYDIASVIEPVVTPQHTCILINTSNSLGIESLVEKRFPKNVVLSLVSAADIVQLGPAEFEHQGNTELWVGPANVNPEIPASIQGDMSEALAMTLSSGQVECKVSRNIQQQQIERMAGPIAFHTTSVVFETPNHSELLELPGVPELVSETLDELIAIAQARRCTFNPDFKERTMQEMLSPKETHSIMYQDYAARRPMEVETYLGSPLKLAKESGVKTPRIATLYAMLHHVNQANQKRSDPPPGPPPPTHRVASGGPPPSRGPGGPNGHMGGPPPMRGGRGSRAPSMSGGPPPMRRGPSNGYPGRGPPPRGQSYDAPSNPMDDFSYLALYDGGMSPDGGFSDGQNGFGDPSQGGGSDLALRERELMLRQKEIALRERELALHRGGGPRASRPPPPPSQIGEFDEDEGEDYFDPMAYRGPPVDPDNIDMMSVTSRRTRKTPSMGQLRQNPEQGMPGPRRGNPFNRPMMRNRTSSRMGDSEIRATLMDNPLLGYSSDRYGPYDRNNMGRESRSGSLTTARLNELQQQGNGYGGYPPMSRRTSQSPGMGPPGMGLPGMGPPNMGPPNMGPPNMGPPTPGSGGRQPSPGYPPNSGRPSPPDMRQPVPRHPPGRGNSVAPFEVEERAGVSNLYPPKSSAQIRSLTGSASASAGSGDSGRSHHMDSENSAFSSQSSLGPRPPIGVR